MYYQLCTALRFDDPCPKVYLRKIPPYVSQEELHDYGTQFGSVIEARLCLHPKTKAIDALNLNHNPHPHPNTDPNQRIQAALGQATMRFTDIEA